MPVGKILGGTGGDFYGTGLTYADALLVLGRPRARRRVRKLRESRDRARVAPRSRDRRAQGARRVTGTNRRPEFVRGGSLDARRTARCLGGVRARAAAREGSARRQSRGDVLLEARRLARVGRARAHRDAGGRRVSRARVVARTAGECARRRASATRLVAVLDGARRCAIRHCELPLDYPDGDLDAERRNAAHRAPHDPGPARRDRQPHDPDEGGRRHASRSTLRCAAGSRRYRVAGNALGVAAHNNSRGVSRPFEPAAFGCGSGGRARLLRRVRRAAHRRASLRP